MSVTCISKGINLIFFFFCSKDRWCFPAGGQEGEKFLYRENGEGTPR